MEKDEESKVKMMKEDQKTKESDGERLGLGLLKHSKKMFYIFFSFFLKKKTKWLVRIEPVLVIMTLALYRTSPLRPSSLPSRNKLRPSMGYKFGLVFDRAYWAQQVGLNFVHP